MKSKTSGDIFKTIHARIYIHTEARARSENDGEGINPRRENVGH